MRTASHRLNSNQTRMHFRVPSAFHPWLLLPIRILCGHKSASVLPAPRTAWCIDHPAAGIPTAILLPSYCRPTPVLPQSYSGPTRLLLSFCPGKQVKTGGMFDVQYAKKKMPAQMRRYAPDAGGQRSEVEMGAFVLFVCFVVPSPHPVSGGRKTNEKDQCLRSAEVGQIVPLSQFFGKNHGFQKSLRECQTLPNR